MWEEKWGKVSMIVERERAPLFISINEDMKRTIEKYENLLK